MTEPSSAAVEPPSGTVPFEAEAENVLPDSFAVTINVPSVLVNPGRWNIPVPAIGNQDRWLTYSPAPHAIPMQRAKIGLAH